MPLPRSSGNNRHGAMQGLRRGVVVGLFGRKPALSAPSPFLGLGLCYWGGGKHVHKASTRRCTPLGHITLYKRLSRMAHTTCKDWSERSPTVHTVSRSVILNTAYSKPHNVGSYQASKNPSPTVAHTVPRSFAPNLIPAEQTPVHTRVTQPNPFPLSSSALTLLSNLASLDHALAPLCAGT